MLNAGELFVGAGGMALGLAKAGFQHGFAVERDQDACRTIRENQRRGIEPVVHWPEMVPTDATTVDYREWEGRWDLLAGGPPCQPFSMGGKHRSISDGRNMFPEVARALRVLKPRAVLLENVKGLLRSSFAKHFEYILLQLSYPEIERQESESWESHLSKLERRQTKGKQEGLSYRPAFRLLNAADYGVPQQRHRVFMVLFRHDVSAEWSFPEPTHSFDRLLWDQWVSGEYWDTHRIASRRRPSPSASWQPRLHRLRESFAPTDLPWQTVRDAVADLAPPTVKDEPAVANHRLQLGARSYKGHTGSPLDLPAKALKAGDHGVPGGENMLLDLDGSVRYFTVRESARLQRFPDEYVFTGSWTECMRQLGNAVPVTLAEIVARSIAQRLAPRASAKAMQRSGLCSTVGAKNGTTARALSAVG